MSFIAGPAISWPAVAVTLAVAAVVVALVLVCVMVVFREKKKG
jgi:hypothetical protein